MHSGNLASGTSLLSNSSHTSSNNMKNSSSSQLKGQSHMSTKTLSNNNSASSQPNALVTGSTTHSQQNNIKVRNDLMPSSTALGNNKSGPGGALPSNTKQQHPNNSYQGNNGIQTPTGSKSSASSLLASSQQKEDSPSSLDANASSNQPKTKAMLKGTAKVALSYLRFMLQLIISHCNRSSF